MKKIKFITLILTIALVAVSCEKYDDYNTDRTVIVGFTKKDGNNINNIPQGGEKSIVLKLYAADIAPVDREYTIKSVTPTLDEGDILTNSENYSFDTTVTILANTHDGEITVTGIDNSISDEDEFFGLAVQEAAGSVVSGQIAIVRLRK